MTKLNCLYRLILGKPLFPKKKPESNVNIKSTSPNPILTLQLLSSPLPDSIEELTTLEAIIAKRMASINSISYSMNGEVNALMEIGQRIRANQTMVRRASLRNDVKLLSEKLLEIQQKRDVLIASRR
jgi:hypothetical protein